MNILHAWIEEAAGSEIVAECLRWIKDCLRGFGITCNDDILSPLSFTYSILIGYFVLLGFVYVYRTRRRSHLKRELREAKEQLKYLQEKLNQMDQDKREVRIFMDGAFDLMHYGHMNAFRLGRSLGTHLVVGVNSDESIIECKAPPLMSDSERLTMVSACKFVDEVVPGCPYIMNKEYLQYVIEKYRIDYVVHGDDPCIVNGIDVYAESKKAGKYRSIPRTEGVSTTDIVGRMLIMTKEHHMVDPSKSKNGDNEETVGCKYTNETDHNNRQRQQQQHLLGQQSKFLTTSRMLKLFSSGVKSPAPGMKVIYIDGAWDMFHPGHVSLLKLAKERGDFLIVGVHGDAVVNRILGMNLPLMNLHERVLSVLGCRYVDDVLIDAPFRLSQEMIASLKVTEVVSSPDAGYGAREESDRFAGIREDMVHCIQQKSKFSMSSILQRIRRNQQHFEARFERKMIAEKEFFGRKHSTNGDSC